MNLNNYSNNKIAFKLRQQTKLFLYKLMVQLEKAYLIDNFKVYGTYKKRMTLKKLSK